MHAFRTELYAKFLLTSIEEKASWLDALQMWMDVDVSGPGPEGSAAGD